MIVEIFVTLKLPGSFSGPSCSLVFKEATVMSEAGEEAAFPAEIGSRGSRGFLLKPIFCWAFGTNPDFVTCSM